MNTPRKPPKPKPRPRPYLKPWMLGAVVLSLNSILGCAASGKLAPMQGELLTVDLTDAQCMRGGPDELAPGFEVFLCATTDRVDAPHKRKGEVHSPMVMVRVPDDNAKAFADAHPMPERKPRVGPVEESL